MLRDRKSLFFGLIILTTVLTFLFLQWPDRFLHYYACDVGQGDAHLIVVGFTQLLIDTGKNSQVLDCLSTAMPFWDRSLEVVIITHADFDHIGGLNEVLSSYQVEQLFINTSTKSYSPELELQLTHLSKSPKALVQGEWLNIQHRQQTVTFHVLWPPDCAVSKQAEQSSKNTSNITAETDITRNNSVEFATRCDIAEENDLSTSGILEYKNFKIFFTGDISSKIEQALIMQNLLVEVDVLKVAHHGSKTSTHQNLIEIARPETAIISVAPRWGSDGTISVFRY